jgi:hypothetical protein
VTLGMMKSSASVFTRMVNVTSTCGFRAEWELSAGSWMHPTDRLSSATQLPGIFSFGDAGPTTAAASTVN